MHKFKSIGPHHWNHYNEPSCGPLKVRTQESSNFGILKNKILQLIMKKLEVCEPD